MSTSDPQQTVDPTADLQQAIEQDHQATNALVRGDPEPKKRMFSQRDDATLANPFGPPVRGREEIHRTLDGVASQLRDGEPIRFQRISTYASADLAYTVEIERNRMKLGTDESSPVALRVTTIYRREADGWRIVHRHADPITTPRPMTSAAEQSSSGDRRSPG